MDSGVASFTTVPSLRPFHTMTSLRSICKQTIVSLKSIRTWFHNLLESFRRSLNMWCEYRDSPISPNCFRDWKIHFNERPAINFWPYASLLRARVRVRELTTFRMRLGIGECRCAWGGSNSQILKWEVVWHKAIEKTRNKSQHIVI